MADSIVSMASADAVWSLQMILDIDTVTDTDTDTDNSIDGDTEKAVLR